jgi:glycogen operon protein
MHDADWHDITDRVLGCLIGQPARASAPLLLLVNPETEARTFMLPPGQWDALLDTAQGAADTPWHGSVSYCLAAHSLVLLSAV